MDVYVNGVARVGYRWVSYTYRRPLRRRDVVAIPVNVLQATRNGGGR